MNAPSQNAETKRPKILEWKCYDPECRLSRFNPWTGGCTLSL